LIDERENQEDEVVMKLCVFYFILFYEFMSFVIFFLGFCWILCIFGFFNRKG